MKEKIYVLCFIALICIPDVQAQNSRINNRNTIGWYNFFGTTAINNKISFLTEYQWRRNDLIQGSKQSLLRFGINYQTNPKLQLRVGYAWVETFAYGDIPINNFGKQFTEHRTFQAVTLNDKISIVEVSNRFMLEQRWIGRYSNEALKEEDEFVFTNRARYMIRAQLPLKGNKIADKTPYLAFYDEMLIGFGKNINENVFDQNRFGLLAGFRFNAALRLEAGYLNQILQLGREVNGRNVFQYNNGIIVNAIVNLNSSAEASKK